MARLHVRLLGTFDVRAGSGPGLTFATKKAQALLGYLAARPGLAHSRESLTAILWANTTEVQARHSLRQTLLHLRKVFALARNAGLVADARTVTLDPAEVDVDVVELERLLADGSPAALERAAVLYRGDLLQGFSLREAPFEDWLQAERERIREIALEALLKLLAHQTRAGAPEAAIQTAGRLLALDALQERVHRTLMRLHAGGGRRGSALKQYQVCVGILQRELGVDPEPETKQLYQEILQQHGRVPVSAAARRSRGAPDVLSPARAASSEGPLIGRSAEVEWLASSLHAAWLGHGRVVVVRGETGIGKTRLVDEMVLRSVRLGGRVLTGRFYEAEQVLPLRAWVDGFRAGGITSDPDVLREFSPVWRAELVRLLPELGESSAPESASAGWVRLFEVVAELVRHLAATQPLLIVLEDLHWADEMSLRLLAFLARRLGARPVLVVVTVREEELSDFVVLRRLLQELEAEGHAVGRSLPSLSRDDTQALVRALARTGSAGDWLAHLCDRVWMTSNGNPFVIVESLRALQDRGTSDLPAETSLPERVREVIAVRLDRLSGAARHLAQVAATIGSDFSFALLQRAGGIGPRETAEAVEELVRRRVLDSVGERFQFSHDRIRTVAADGILPPRRVALHAAIGDALEASRGPHLEEAYDRLAYHFARADDPIKAFTYLVLVADQTLLRYAVEEAIRILRDALGYVERLPVEDRDRRHVDALLRLAFALSLLGRFRDILELLLPHRERVGRLRDPSIGGPYHFRLALTYSYLGDNERSGMEAEQAIEEATRGGDTSTIGKAHYVLAVTGCWAGEPRQAVEHGRQAIALLEGGTERHWLGLSCWALGFAHQVRGEFTTALQLAGRIRTIGDEGRDRRLQSFAEFSTGLVLAARGEGAAAVAACRRAVELAPDPFCALTAEGCLGVAYVENGDADQAIPLLRHVVEQLGQVGLRQAQARYMAYLADAHALAGELETARVLAGRSLETSRDARTRWAGALGHRTLGRIAQASGSLTEAATHLESALETFAAMGAQMEVGRTHLALASLAGERGDVALATQHLAQAREAFRSLDAPRYAERAEELARALGA